MIPFMIAGAALSGMAAISSNASITAQANANAAATREQLNQTLGVTNSNIKNKTRELNEQVGMQLTQLVSDARKATGQVTATLTERNIYGATAARASNQVKMEAALMTDNIVQKGEAAMSDLQTEYSNAKYNYEKGNLQASIDQANMLSQRQGSFEIAAGMASSAVSFGSAGYALSKT